MQKTHTFEVVVGVATIKGKWDGSQLSFRDNFLPSMALDQALKDFFMSTIQEEGYEIKKDKHLNFCFFNGELCLEQTHFK